MEKKREKRSKFKAMKRTLAHDCDAEGSAQCVRYRFKALPARVGGGQCAVVVPRNTLSEGAFLEAIARQTPGFNPTVAKFYLEAIFGHLAVTLRQGNAVTLSGIATFGLSIVGKVAEGQTQLNATHALRPWARFAQRFTDEVNDGAHLLPFEGLPVLMQPAEGGLVALPKFLALRGTFRSPDQATYDIETAEGNHIPCTLHGNPTSATRNECTAFTLQPQTPLTPGATGTLHIRYTDATRTPAHLTLPFTVQP